MRIFRFFRRNMTIGRVVRYFILADLFLLAGWGLVSPVFAVYVLQRIQEATVITIGISAAIYWVPKSIIQVPIAIFLDKTPSERDDFLFLILGLTLAGITAIGFVFINQVWQLYLLQLFHGIGMALYVPSWNGIFSRHLDKNHHSLDFALDSTVIGLASGITGLLGGLLVTFLGFNTIFILAALFSFLSAVVVFFVPQFVFPHRSHKGIVIRNHTPKSASN